MNFYKHHIGDYAQATAHLSFVEDAAYSRMLRKYYAEEKPLPADLKAVQRLVGARTRDEKEAVALVLEEFFTLADDGWHNKRADAELGRANAQAEANRRVAIEREASQRTLPPVASAKGATTRSVARMSASSIGAIGRGFGEPIRDPRTRALPAGPLVSTAARSEPSTSSTPALRNALTSSSRWMGMSCDASMPIRTLFLSIRTMVIRISGAIPCSRGASSRVSQFAARRLG